MAPSDDEPRVYAVVLTEPAEAEIDAAYLNVLSRTTLEFADRWHDGILHAIEGLSLFPESHPIAEPESRRVGRRVRRVLVKQGRLAYKVLFTLIDIDSDGSLDTVRVLHVRHAAHGEVD